jgi:hypothetical protein
MVADKYERYAISHVPEGLQISLWQALPSLGFGVIALVILTACFLTDPYPGHVRIWAGLGVVALALVALFGVRSETWIISDGAIRYKSSLWHEEISFESSPGAPLVLRIEFVPCDPDGTEPPFPHIVHLIGPHVIEFGAGFQFRTRTSLDRFLETLRAVVPVDVEEVRAARGLPDDARNSI